MTELCRIAAAYYHNETVQLLVRTIILDHRVSFLTAIVLVFVRSHCCNFYFYFVLVLCPAISSRSRSRNTKRHNFRFSYRFRFRYENGSAKG